MKKLPKEIYAYFDDTDGLPCLMAQQNIKGIDDGTLVGIYELKETKKIKITETLE